MKKAIGMFVALILALGMSGLAYAHWSEILTISGTVNTGELDAEWSTGASWDNEPPEKDVSYIKCWVDYNADPDGHVLTVKVHNAYPSIDYYQLIDLHNSGTIPLHIDSFNLTDSDLPGDATVEILSVASVYGAPLEENPNRPMLPLAIINAPQIVVSTQLHPSETAWGILHIHLGQDAIEETIYTFTYKVEVVQWNWP